LTVRTYGAAASAAAYMRRVIAKCGWPLANPATRPRGSASQDHDRRQWVGSASSAGMEAVAGPTDRLPQIKRPQYR